MSFAFTIWPAEVRLLADMLMLPVLVTVMPVASVSVPTDDSALELAIGTSDADDTNASKNAKIPKTKYP